MAATVISIPATLVPTLGRSRDCNRGVAASLIGRVRRRQSLGDGIRNGGVAASLVRGIGCRQSLCDVFSRVDCCFWVGWGDGRGAAG